METIAFDLRQTPRTPLASAHVQALRAAGSTRAHPAGTLLAVPGAPMDHFILVEDGEVEVVDLHTGNRRVASTIGPGQFLGEIAFLAGGRWTLPLRAVCDTRVIEVPREIMLRLMSENPEMSDIVIGVLAARRRRQIEDRDGALQLIGEESSPSVRRVAQFVARNRIAYQSFPLGSDNARHAADRCGLEATSPLVIFGRDQVVESPSPAKIAALLGVDLPVGPEEEFDLLIVGGGPAGVAAAVYAGAEGLQALVAEDLAIGGQAGASSRIENYLGFPTGISGADLVWRGEVQAMKFGTRFAMPLRAIAITRREEGGFCVGFDDGRSVCARAVVVATGVEYRKLALPRLEEFEGNGVYYAATELEARYCRDTDAVVVGGGNSAGQAAMYLSRHARHVHLVVRGPSLASSMSDYLSRRLRADDRITVHLNSEVAALGGSDRLEHVTIRANATGAVQPIDCRALFVMAGAAPNTAWLGDLVALDSSGFILTGSKAGSSATPYSTSCAGIFAVGDVRAASVKRVASAVGEGSVVISEVYRYLAPETA